MLALGFRGLFLLQKVLELSKMRLTMRVEQVQLKISALCGVRQRALPF